MGEKRPNLELTMAKKNTPGHGLREIVAHDLHVNLTFRQIPL
jgi:hypothetical protein